MAEIYVLTIPAVGEIARGSKNHCMAVALKRGFMTRWGPSMHLVGRARITRVKVDDSEYRSTDAQYDTGLVHGGE